MVKSALNALSAYKPGKPLEEVRRELGLQKIYKLASNENPFGTSKAVSRILREGSIDLSYYPDGAGRVLREAIAKFHDVPTDQILLGSGLDDVIQIISRAVLEPGDNIIEAAPTFSQYSLHATIEGAETISLPVDETTGKSDLTAMANAVNARTKIIWLCNPNNPTGTISTQREVLTLLESVPKDVLVISDEAYYEYATSADYPDTFALLDQFPNVIIMRTFSKIYGLAGLRIGYAIIPEALSEPLNIVRLPFNTSSIAQSAATAALADQAFVKKCVDANTSGLQQWYDFLDARGLTYYKSDANFIFFDTKRDATELFNKLLQKGYIVRAGLKPNWLRITIGSTQENQGCIQALTSILEEK
ncbi:histidinol-phosphate aminotransferase [Listeria grandensis FSL F6-0971]|uniref:Histidinol-phosphate aminotransferase n=1 Tax=Listeria grandensis FSL F6-0971 TaxID=1265819 RepID=W7BGK1_9LIST|nr:histidinol-phosphate transaminase [Listeria grandensis]EUJ23955.1 histidinol-phosphate aminotransferase [Listeria grandensis FSL F6-0971]